MAITLTPAELSGIIGAEDSDAIRLHAVASARVVWYAPGAPAIVQDEAVVRYAGYLYGSGGSMYGAYTSVEMGAGTKVASPAHHAAAFRNSGAEGLLAPWRVRNAGIIGGASE